jgi:ubiquinone/menaquinone biosynthesis C-methylase UbiE
MRHFFDTIREMLGAIDCQGGKVLEAGCGEGHFTAFLSELLGDNCHIDAFDVGESAVEKAKKWMRGGTEC